MIRNVVIITISLLLFPLVALADSGVSSTLVNLITGLPEFGTLGLLGSGLVAFAILVRRKMKMV